MQFRTSGHGFSINDRKTALTVTTSGALLTLAGIAILAVAVVRAGEAGGAAIVETAIFGIAATAFGAFLLRTGARALRKLGTSAPVQNAKSTAPEELDKAA